MTIAERIAAKQGQTPATLTLTPGKTYRVKHSSGFINARFVGARSIERRTGYGISTSFRTIARYDFINLATGREITVKSKLKIKREVV